MSLIQQALDKAQAVSKETTGIQTSRETSQTLYSLNDFSPAVSKPVVSHAPSRFSWRAIFLTGFAVLLIPFGLFLKMHFDRPHSLSELKSPLKEAPSGAVNPKKGALRIQTEKPVSVGLQKTVQQTMQNSVVSPAAALPALLPSMAEPRYRLTGITSMGQDQFAIINDQVVGVGESLEDEVTVVKISAKTVILNSKGNRITLNL